MFAGVFDGMEMGSMFDFFETDEDMVNVDSFDMSEETFTEMEFEEPPMIEGFEEFEEMSVEIYEELDMPMDMYEELPPAPEMEMEIEAEIDMDIDEGQTTTFESYVDADEPPDMNSEMFAEEEVDMDIDEQPSMLSLIHI